MIERVQNCELFTPQCEWVYQIKARSEPFWVTERERLVEGQRAVCYWRNLGEEEELGVEVHQPCSNHFDVKHKLAEKQFVR